MKPILFNTAMVRAILEGRKTITRRVVKPQEKIYVFADHSMNGEERSLTPFWPGDILYVREAWQQNYDGSYSYRAGDKFEDEKGWRPSIHMPKEAARLFLRVTGVWVERLQYIDEKEALMEGARSTFGFVTSPENEYAPPPHSAREDFRCIWDSTVRPKDRDLYGWAANPWVFAIKFERITKEEAQAAEVSG